MLGDGHSHKSSQRGGRGMARAVKLVIKNQISAARFDWAQLEVLVQKHLRITVSPIRLPPGTGKLDQEQEKA